jgi:hypothetical protein
MAEQRMHFARCDLAAFDRHLRRYQPPASAT